MFPTLISVALLTSLAIKGARADFNVTTPTLVQCQPATLTWSGNYIAPVNVIIVPSDDECGDELADLGDFNASSATWTVNIPAGQSVTFSLQDAKGDEAWSAPITIQGSSADSCLNSTSAANSTSGLPTSASGGANTTGSAEAPESPVASPPVVNDAPATTSNAAVPVGAANTGDNPTSAGFTIHQLSIPVMIFSMLAAFTLF
ncbi:uncharacterized protein FIBRA_02137 [Fibroporia radiculosa]|uniref:Uncharacterized protein n=1 Tax=Fibroporia radiculosa TaxID=599839 RepID=J4GMI0_9APHY|nr:uncharacterized protein FIBRA_02137 [Fibroporia radiculosa]CCM00110.1 predicted protein [Fibroporia radiculosa]